MNCYDCGESFPPDASHWGHPCFGKNPAVDRPEHYRHGRFEAIDIIEEWKLGFHLGNSLKYIARAGKKDPAKEIEDLEKAAWYLRRHIAALKILREFGSR